MKDYEATNLRDALKRFDAWIASTIGGKDDHIHADLVLINAHARDVLDAHDKSVVEAEAEQKRGEAAAAAAEAKRVADAAKAEAEVKARGDAIAAAEAKARDETARRVAAAETDAARRDDVADATSNDMNDTAFSGSGEHG
jgi:hypothetical protein